MYDHRAAEIRLLEGNRVIISPATPGRHAADNMRTFIMGNSDKLPGDDDKPVNWRVPNGFETRRHNDAMAAVALADRPPKGTNK